MLRVHVTDLIGDFIHLQAGSPKQLLGTFHSELTVVIHKILPRFLLKVSGQIGRIHLHVLRYAGKRYLFAQMSDHKLADPFHWCSLLVFLLAQGLGSLLLFGIWILVSPEFGEAIRAFLSGETEGLPLLELMPISVFSLILMSLDIIAVLGCHLCLHNIRFATTLDATTVRWRPALLAAAAAILGAMSISILTGGMELPEAMVQISLAMSHNIWGLITIVLVGPISEELLFREAIAGEMLRRGAAPWLAIGVSALAFSAAHLNLAQGCYAFPLGILLGIIYYKTGGIVHPCPNLHGALRSTQHCTNDPILEPIQSLQMKKLRATPIETKARKGQVNFSKSPPTFVNLT